jgi:hypothetical protein
LPAAETLADRAVVALEARERSKNMARQAFAGEAFSGTIATPPVRAGPRRFGVLSALPGAIA